MTPKAVSLGLILLIAPSAKAAGACPDLSPAAEFGPLYAAVEQGGVFADSKTFADADPKEPPTRILAAFAKEAPRGRPALAAFVSAHFTLPAPAPATAPEAARPLSLAAHIDTLWDVLVRPPRRPAPFSSALSLPRPFVLPGGRFRELYYWDSYFTLVGLKASGRTDLVEDMLENFGSLIDRYGFVPNGARTYYLSRSQPPFYYAMIALSEVQTPAVLARRMRRLRREHAFWMAGATGLRPGQARRRVVRLADGSLLNRYFDACPRPRDEAFIEDERLAETRGRDRGRLYQDLRSAAESGWDFSSRWTSPSGTLSKVRTSRIAPVDLNSLLFGMEREIADLCRKLARRRCARRFDLQAAARRRAVERHLFDRTRGIYGDLDLDRSRITGVESAALLYPLFVGLASPARARGQAMKVRQDLLAPGGLRTTLSVTGQQWDAPNGWAPLQWIAAVGLSRYGEGALASEIAHRFLAEVSREYDRSGRILEKYDVERDAPGGGGEYPTQDGFGWTNGVVRAFLAGLPPAPS